MTMNSFNMDVEGLIQLASRAVLLTGQKAGDALLVARDWR